MASPAVPVYAHVLYTAHLIYVLRCLTPFFFGKGKLLCIPLAVEFSSQFSPQFSLQFSCSPACTIIAVLILSFIMIFARTQVLWPEAANSFMFSAENYVLMFKSCCCFSSHFPHFSRHNNNKYGRQYVRPLWPQSMLHKTAVNAK